MENNKAYILRGKLNANIEPVPAPAQPGPNELLLRTLNVGICGSDVHYWKTLQCANFIVKDWMVLGHETSAEVVAVGPDVKDFVVGDRVATEPAVPCRLCNYCRTDRYNLCPDMWCHATPPHKGGTLVNYFLHPADYTFKVPAHVSAEEAAMIEPLSVAVHANKRAKVTVGSRVLITGAGPIGLYNLMVARAYGAIRVVITDINAERLKLAKELGADETILVGKELSEEATVEAVKEAFEGARPDVSIECSGAPSSVRLLLLSSDAGGTVILVGMGPSEMSLPITQAAFNEVTILGSFRYKNCFQTAIDLVASGRLPHFKRLISHRFAFADTTKAYQTALDGVGIKIMIKVAE